jgi:hypothetical protein
MYYPNFPGGEISYFSMPAVMDNFAKRDDI